MGKKHKNHIISRKKIRTFLESHPEHAKAKPSFDHWYKTLEFAKWDDFSDVRETFGTASKVGKFVVFNVGGNKFRIVTELKFEHTTFLIRHVLTHEEYDQDQWKA